MSANTEKRRHSLANFKIDDPGASGTISGRNSGYVDIVTAGAESRTVDTPVRGGLELTLNGKTLAGAATIAVTNYIGTDDSLVLSTNGDCIVLKSVDVNGTLTWKQVGGTKWESASHIAFEDGNDYTAQTTVEAALDEILGGLVGGSWGIIPMPLNCWRKTSNLDVGDTTANGGVLASDTTPVLDAINAATDGCQRILWASSNNDQISQSVILPLDLDPTADITFRCRLASGGTTNAVGLTLASYFNEGDTAVADSTSTNQTTSYTEELATIALADIGAGIGDGTTGTLTIGLTPVAHTSDTLAMSASWLVYKKKLIQP